MTSKADKAQSRTDALFNARVEEEVRRRLSAVLGRAGLPETDVAKEVLYWMPQEFVEYYADLFLRALRLEGRGREGLTRTNTEGERVAIADNSRGGVGKPKRKRGETEAAFAERTRGTVSPNGARSTGKRYKSHYIIRDDGAFAEKSLVDRRLMELVDGRSTRARQTRRKHG